jgi:hypothetical protein
MNRKRRGRKQLWLNLMHPPGICLEGLRKSMNNLSDDRQSPGGDPNPGSIDTKQAGQPVDRHFRFRCG